MKLPLCGWIIAVSEGPASTLSGFPLLFRGVFMVVCVTGISYFQWWLKLFQNSQILGLIPFITTCGVSTLIPQKYSHFSLPLSCICCYPTAIGWVKLEGPSLTQYLISEDGQGQMTEEGCGKRAKVVRLPQNTLQPPRICGSGSSWARDGAFVFNSSDGFFFCEFVHECLNAS